MAHILFRLYGMEVRAEKPVSISSVRLHMNLLSKEVGTILNIRNLQGMQFVIL